MVQEHHEIPCMPDFPATVAMVENGYLSIQVSVHFACSSLDVLLKLIQGLVHECE